MVPLADLCAKQPALRRRCYFALGRIRTREAMDVLKTERDGLRGSDDPGAVGLRRLVDFLESDDFLEQEKALQRIRKRNR
ncbi:MAG: hypothetical protein ACYTG4_01480 [Planctomycetota bacterium]